MPHETWLTEARPPIENPQVAYQGIEGSFSEGACRAYFGKDVHCTGMQTFGDVVASVMDGSIDYGMLPIENSSTGSITEVYDLIAAYPVCIVGERVMEVTQNLLALPGVPLEDVERVYSHPQGLFQSKHFLDQHGLQGIAYDDTAMAAKMIAEEKMTDAAAIASRRAAEVYGLDVLVPHVNFNFTNKTRFFVIRAVPEYHDAQNKATVAFKVAHRPGALYDALRYFANGAYDMTRIESRPVLGKPWEYAFYIDLLGSCHDSFFIGTLSRVRDATVDFRFLGAYVSAEEREVV